MALKLYTYPGNPRAWKALVAAEYVGVKIAIPEFVFGVTNKTPEFLRLNPLGKIPTLETPEGGIFDSNPIARAVARFGDASKAADLLGRSPYEEGVIDSWLSFAANELELPLLAWLLPILGHIPYSAEGTRQAKEDIRKLLGVLNEHLTSRTYLVGERVTLADIVVACTLHGLYTKVLDPAARQPFPHVNRWFTTIVNQPNFHKVAGDTVLTETEATYDAAKAKEHHHHVTSGEAHPGKKEKGGKKEKAEKEPKESAGDKKEGGGKKGKGGAKAEPAAEKAEAPKAAERSLEELAEEEEAKAAKKKNPLDSLPPTDFQLDPFKKLYSNSKNIRKDVCPEFWRTYDPAGYSLWHIKYRYNEENTVGFKACNQVGGWLQRLDKLHKYAFGNILILGKAPNLEVEGVWMFRGNDVPADVLEGDDYPLYDWRRMDHAAAADRQIVDDFWVWDGPSLGGKDVLDGKTFK